MKILHSTQYHTDRQTDILLTEIKVITDLFVIVHSTIDKIAQPTFLNNLSTERLVHIHKELLRGIVEKYSTYKSRPNVELFSVLSTEHTLLFYGFIINNKELTIIHFNMV